MEKGIFREARSYDKLPKNVYFEKNSGEIISLTHPVDADLGDWDAEPTTLLRSFKQLEKYHGAVPSRFGNAAENLRQIGRHVKKLGNAKLQEIGKETAKAIANGLIRRILNLSRFADWTSQVRNWLTEQGISTANRSRLNAAVITSDPITVYVLF